MVEMVETFSYLLTLVLLFQLVYYINHQCETDQTTQPDLQDRLTEIVNEISILKTEKVEDRKEIQQLGERVALLEDTRPSLMQHQAIKYPSIFDRSVLHDYFLCNFFLIAQHSRRRNETEEDSTPPRFYGPPTNFCEMQQLGYTLNGYYLVKGTEKLNSNQIQVVYCQFRHPPGENNQVSETWIGNVQIKTKRVHFYVQRSTKYSNDSGKGQIIFDVDQLNIGGAMNLTTGYFTAPMDGIYHFEFRCLKDNVPKEIAIYLVVKQKSRTIVIGENPIAAGAYMSNLSYHSTGSITASLNLKASDEVGLYTPDGRENLYESHSHYTQFAGWLVEEDLAVP